MWIIQLRSPDEGERYYTARGKNVTNFKDKAKVFSDKQAAEDIAIMAHILWPEAKVIPA